MTLLHLAIAYMLGISLGKWVWDYGLLPCDISPWSWWVPFGLLFFAPALRRWEVAVREDSARILRWPASAGFEPPRPVVSLTLGVGLLLCLLIGVFRYAAQPLTPCWTPTDLAYYNLPASQAFDRGAVQVTLEGYINAYPTQEDDRYQLNIAVEKLVLGTVARPVHGTALVQSYDHRPYHYGDAVRVTGRLVTPPDFEDFSYREYLARSGVHSLLYDAAVEQLATSPRGARFYRLLYAVRARAQEILNRSLPEPYAALASGILLGIDSSIPDDLYEQFNLAGISHLLVISGSNVALIVAVALALSQRLVGQKLAVYLAITAIALYALLVGAEAAVLRAAWMGGLVVFAGAIKRRSTALISLAAAAICLMLINPSILWDVGFQLSSMATAGLILFIPPITQWVAKIVPGFQGGFLTSTHASPTTQDSGDASSGRAKGFWYALIADSLIVTLAANMMVLPLLVYYFGRVSVISVVANLLVAAVQPMILLSGTFGIVIGLIGLEIVAKIFLWVAWLGLYWTTLVAKWAAHLPGASLEVARFGWVGLSASYALIAVTYIASQHKGKVNLSGLHPRRIASFAGLGVLTGIAMLVWGAVGSLPDGRLHVYFLDIGQGDGVLVQTPSGRQVLIDGGASRERLLTQLGEVMPWWDRSLDLLLVTHPDRDHIGAQTTVPERYAIDYALETPASVQDPDALAWREAVVAGGAVVTVQHDGGWVDLGDGVALWVLWPRATPLVGDDASNENSMVTKLVYGDFSVLLTGDAGIPSESTWLAEGLPLTATVLKVGHHGSARSTSTGLVAAVDPQWAVIQVGADNTYGHPTQEALDALAGRIILRNDEDGRLHFATDGRAVWLETER